MSNNDVNTGRRRFLVGASCTVGAVGSVGVAVPFVRSWNPSEKAKAAGAPIKVNIAKLEEGAILGPFPEWRGKPIFVVKRSDEAMAALEANNDRLTDPLSEREQQPAYAQNLGRARDEQPNILVLEGLCTHLGCSPKFRPEVKPEEFEKNWTGGFFCPCHGSKFDLAGRVYSGVPAPTNLKVPPYSYESENVLVVGVDGETA